MPYPALDISGKVCLVTGGTSGIGRAIALGFAEAGATVVAASTNPEKVSSIKVELSRHGASHDAVRIDVSDVASVRGAIEGAAKKYGRLDAVVNAAGVIKKQPSLEMPPEEFERIVRVNLTGSFIVNQAAGRVMKEQPPDARGVRGSILKIASGVFPTDLNRPLIEGTARGEWLRRHTPMDRFGNATELVGAAVYLVSDA